MNRRNRMSAGFCLILGLAVSVKGVSLGLRMNQEMGPGFFPFLAGGILVLLSVILFIQSSVKDGRPGYKESFWIDSNGKKRVLLTLLVTGAYPVVINHLGFLLSTLLLLFFLFRVIAHLKWKLVGVVGTATAVCSYLIFEVWLRANLPRNILGF